MMTMMKIKMETNYTQVIKIREEKNKNTITREDKVVEKNKNMKILKDNNDLTTGQSKIKKITAIEQEIKSEREKMNTREGPKEIKQKQARNLRQLEVIIKPNKNQRKEECKGENKRYGTRKPRKGN